MNSKFEFLKVFTLDGKNLKVFCPDKDRAVMAVAGHIAQELFSKNNQEPLDVLLGVIVHVLSMDTSGNLEKELLDNIKEHTPKYREYYKNLAEQMKREKN